MTTPIIAPRDLELLADLLAKKVADRLANRPVLVDIHELSRITGLSVPTLERRAREGIIPRIKSGRRTLFDPAAVVRALASVSDRGTMDSAADRVAPENQFP